MSLLIRKVRNELSFLITLKVPGNDPNKVVLLNPSVTVDLLDTLSEDELEELQTELSGLISRGSVSSQGVVDLSVLHAAEKLVKQPLSINPAVPSAIASYSQSQQQLLINLVNELKIIVDAMNNG